MSKKVIRKKSARILTALLLALAMIVTYMPAIAFADWDDNNRPDGEVWINTVDRSCAVLPGSKLDLEADGWYKDESVSIKYSWTVVEGDADYRLNDDEYIENNKVYSKVYDGNPDQEKGGVYKNEDYISGIASPENDSSLATVTINPFADDGKWWRLQHGFSVKIKATMSAYDRDDAKWYDVCESKPFEIDIEDDFLEIHPVVSNAYEYMLPGESKDVTVEALFAKENNLNGYPNLQTIDSSDIKSIEWIESEDETETVIGKKVTITPKNQGITNPKDYTINRISTDEINFGVEVKLNENISDEKPYYDWAGESRYTNFYMQQVDTDLDRYWIDFEGLGDNDWRLYVDTPENNTIAVKVRSGDIILPETAYELYIERETWEDGQSIYTPVQNGDLDLDESGQGTFRVRAVAVKGGIFTGETKSWIDLVYNKSLSAPDISIGGVEPREGFHPMTDYVWFATGTTPAPTVIVSVNGHVVDAANYTVTYVEGEDEFDEAAAHSDTFPTAAGTYSVFIQSKKDSGYTGSNGQTKLVIMTPEDLAKAEAADNAAKPVRNKIGEMLNVDSLEEIDADKAAEARKAYNNLTAEQKKYVYDRYLKHLEAAEFIVLMRSIDQNDPDAAAVKEARTKYESCKEMVGDRIPGSLVSKLVAAEKKLSDNETAQKAQTVGATTDTPVGKVTVTSGSTVSFTKASNTKSVVVPDTVNIYGKEFAVTTIEANAFKGTKATSVTAGKNINMIKANAFKGSKIKTLTVKTTKLTKKSVKGALKGSKIKTVKVKVGNKKTNKKYVTKYKKFFTKKNAGKQVAVK